MALYTTTAEAAARLSRYAGMTVPSVEPEGTSVMDSLVVEASRLIEEYIGYPWADIQYTEVVNLDRTGMGQLMNPSPVGKQVKSLDAISIPARAQYKGPLLVDINNVEWNAFGMIHIGHLPIAGQDNWQAPVVLREYPSQLEVSYTAGPLGTLPAIFEDICVKIVAVLVLQEEDTDMLVSSKIDLKDMGLESENTFLRDPIAQALRPLARYKS